MESSDLGKHSRTHSCLFSICDNIVSEVLKTHTASSSTYRREELRRNDAAGAAQVCHLDSNPPPKKKDTDT